MERLTGLLFRGLLAALSVMSLTWQRRLGLLLGSIAWLCRAEGARITRINLALCFPDLQPGMRSRLERQSLQQSAMLLTEMGTLNRWPIAEWRELAVAVEGESLLQQTAGDERGVLILVPHFGNWEFLALVLGQYGVTALYDPPRQRALEPLIRDARSRAGATLLPINARGLRGFYQALSAGGVTALLPDQVPERRAGLYADFFGHPALTMTFAHRLMQRTSARVLLGAAVRCPGGFRVLFRDAGSAVRDPDPHASARAMNAAIEQLVREEPAQYQWEYKRFRRPPAGAANPYR